MKIYLSLILPCFNEEEHLKVSFKKLYSVLKRLKKPYEVIFVDDFSQDKTLKIIDGIVREYRNRINLRVITHKKNLGRGKSVVDGFGFAQGTTVGFIDVDLEVGPEYILKALPLLADFDVVVGRRSFAFTFPTIHRFVSSKVYAWMVRKLLKLPINDSEAGFKFFRKNMVVKIIPYASNSGWFWDTEIVALAKIFGLKITEIPVRYIRRTDKTSTVNTVKDSFIYLLNLGLFLFRFKTGKLKKLKKMK